MHRIATMLALALWLISPTAWSVPITYSVTGAYSAEIEGPIQNPWIGTPATNNIYSVGQTIGLTFQYDSSVAGINFPAAAFYPGAFTNLVANIGSDTLSAAFGSAFVNDNFNGSGDDLMQLSADPGIFADTAAPRDVTGFSATDSGGNTWIAANLRLIFINGDFLSSEDLPGSLLGLSSTASRLALDFWDIAPVFDSGGAVVNGASAHLAFFDVTGIEAIGVPEPATLSLLGAGLFGLILSRRRRRESV